MSRIKLSVLIVASVIAFFAMISVAPTQQPAAPRRTVFSSLKVGQPVVLREKGSMYEISTMDDVAPLTHKVIEIGDDYIVLQDVAEVTEIRIPVTAIRAVIHLKTKRK